MIEEDKLNALELFGENEYLHKEIERLQNQNKVLNETYELTKKEYIRLNNIIKEVRERLIKPSKFIERTERLKLLEILDKESE